MIYHHLYNFSSIRVTRRPRERISYSEELHITPTNSLYLKKTSMITNIFTSYDTLVASSNISSKKNDLIFL